MRKIFTLLLLFSSYVVSAQNNLSYAKKGSRHTYVYKVSVKEAEELYRSDMNKVADRYLHTLVDSFAKNEPALPAGNYLFAAAVQNQLQVELKAIGDVQFKLVNNNRDLVVALHRKSGELITDAVVTINNKTLKFDGATQTFRKEKYRKGGRLLVYYNNAVYAFEVKPQNQWKPYTNFWRKLTQSFPLRYIMQPFSKWFGKNTSRYYNFFYRTAHEQNFRGFMAFSKPKYKPGDTAKAKAFVTTAKGKPLDQKLLLRLSNRQFDTDTILTTVSPYRNGGYEFSFVLSDSLDMDLDEEYLLTLETEESRKFEITEEQEDEQKIAAKRKVVMRGRFYYEEYELKSIQFSTRSNQKEHNRGEEVAVFAKATDENGMAVMDGRIQVIVKPTPYGNKRFGAPTVFLPDTLWRHELPLEMTGETRINILDSIFPEARFEYEVECIFLNSNNERQVQTLRHTFDNRIQRIDFTAEDDSLQIVLLQKGKSIAAAATLYAFNDKDDTIERRRIELPFTVKLHPFAKTYLVKTDSVTREYEPKSIGQVVSALASRTKDSVFVQLVNPQKLPVWYTLFAGNKVLVRGRTDSLFYADKVRTAKNYFVSLQYLYNGVVRNEDFVVPYQDKLLNVKFQQPDVVYPGQTTDISIAVTDAEGRPVPDADVTAWAATKKFNDLRLPFVPYLGKLHSGRKRYRNFQEEETEYERSIKLTWQRWSREMHLDTAEYYKFLRPQQLYINTEPAPDSLTQLAPFVVKDGELLPVHLLYIDEVPTFFSAAEGLKRYSFPVSPGRHALRIRTNKQLIFLDSIWITKGTKTFLSINADTSNKRIRMQAMPDSLTNYEKNLWSKYMILVDAAFGEKFATIQTDHSIFLLNPQGYQRTVLTGPLTSPYARFTLKNGFTQDFETEGGDLYQFRKGLIKQKQWYNFSPLRMHLLAAPVQYSFRDFVLTEKEIDSLWRVYLYNRSAAEDLFRNPAFMKKGNGELQIGVTKDSVGIEPFIRNIFLFKYNDPDYLRIYKGASRNLGYVEPGKYRMLLLMKGDRYFIKDSIFIKKDGINFYETGKIVPKERDSLSLRISDIINQREKAFWYNEATTEFNAIKETFNERYLDSLLLTETISGVVTDIKGKPIAFASVVIKGTRTGTTTDANGRFILRSFPNSTLVISSVGYGAEERKVDNNEAALRFTLVQSHNSLSEVVVVGYGNQRRRDVTSSVSSVMTNELAGKVAGVIIRGTNSVSIDTSPLIIVDGIPYSGTMASLDPSLIASTNVLKDADATALYGERGANGVVIITTKKAKEAVITDPLLQATNSLRTAFRDDAWWQPKLRTDRNGIASFRTTYPDDITAWQTFAIAITDHRQSGSVQAVVRSFKAVSGNLALPQFAVEGDSITIIGKALNYLPDSMQAKRSFYLNNKLVNEQAIAFKNAWIDTFSVVAPAIDSLKLKYTVQKPDGYFDGEERRLPVFKQGVKESIGFFAALRRDTTFSITPKSDSSLVKIYAETSVLPTLEKEVEYLRNYEYLCNEQLASKLKGLLVQKRIDSLFNRPFRYGKQVSEIITKLTQGKHSSGLWGWWAANTPSMWISLHVTEALVQASAQGFVVSINKPALIDYLVYQLENENGVEELSALHLLHLLGAKADYKKYSEALRKSLSRMSLYQKLRLAELEQKTGLEYAIDSLLAKQSRTMLGNSYWGEEDYRLFDNSFQNTIVMYRLLKAKGGYNDLLGKMRDYFLERRRSGNWRNTYESSLILETVLPDLLVNDSLPKASTVMIGNQTVNHFPFAAAIQGRQAISVNKSGAWPVYFTAYEEAWNPAPQKEGTDFTVKTAFEKGGETITKLKGGEPVTLKATVTVKADAEYVMVEIPIPAGCSYNDKRQTYSNNEVHREYFKNKVSIFCSGLKKGEYVFTVSLLPRYAGRYNLNPAKAELMYFPVFYGREGMKTTVIK